MFPTKFHWRTIEIERRQRVNEQIKISPVRVITAEGGQLGVLPTEKALEAAREADLDLVEVAPDADPPVCRIMDFGKYKYQQAKRQGHTHRTKVKEIRVRPKTGKHDIDVRVNRARNFLNRKDKVVVTVQFRGRELAHIDEGERVLREIIDQLEDISKIESPPKRSGRRIECRLAPK